MCQVWTWERTWVISLTPHKKSARQNYHLLSRRGEQSSERHSNWIQVSEHHRAEQDSETRTAKGFNELW